MELKLEQVVKLQNDIEVLLKKYTDDTGVIKDWKVQSIAGSIVKNLIIPLVSKPKGTFCPSKDRCACYMESECFADTSLKYGCYRAK